MLAIITAMLATPCDIGWDDYFPTPVAPGRAPEPGKCYKKLVTTADPRPGVLEPL